MNADRLCKRWRRPLREGLALIRRRRSRATLNATQVHALRVALRRTRLLLEIGRPLLKKSSAQQLRRHARQLLDALGPVRDCDVALDWLPRDPSARRLRREVRHERQRQWRRARQKLKQRLPPLRLPPKRRTPPALVRRWQRLHTDTQSRCRALLGCLPTLDPAELHELRRRIRGWRYLLELTVRRRNRAEITHLQRLVKIQASLGEAQNLAAIAGTLARLAESPETRRWQTRVLRAQRAAHRRAWRALARMKPPLAA